MSVKEIIKQMKWLQLKRLSNSQKINKLLQCLHILSNISYQSCWQQWIHKNDTKKLLDLSHSGFLWQFHINNSLNQPLDKNTLISVTIGKWGSHYLNLSTARHQQGLYQIGYLSQPIFDISRYHYDLALRIALYISIESRINPSHTYSVQVLLQSKYSAQEIKSIFKNVKQRYQLRQTLVKALAKLQEMNWFIKILSSLQKNDLLYYDTKIYIKPNPCFSVQKLVNDSFITGDKIKQSRLKKQLTQQQLADKVMVSKTTISKIENGQLLPSSLLLQDLLNNLNL